MKIILLKDVEKLGKKNDIKNVADGYARNFLIPKKLAVLATKSEIAKLAEQKKIEAEKAEEELKLYQELASQIDGLELEISAKIAEEGKLFGTVTTSQIAEKLKENLSGSKALQEGLEIKKEQVKLEQPIKEIGEYEATIEFPHNLEVKVKVIVVEEK